MESHAVLPRPLASPVAALLPLNYEQDSRLEDLLVGEHLYRRSVHARQTLFRAGQSHRLFLIHAGCFKTSVISQDGREKITGFRMRGELLGIDAIDMPMQASDAVAMDSGEVWELPILRLCYRIPQFHRLLTAQLASEIRSDWNWMLVQSSLSAEKRVTTFLLDFADRLEQRGMSGRCFILRMTRAELGNFLGLQLETVTRALSHLHAQGLIDVERREIRIKCKRRLQAMLSDPINEHGHQANSQMC